MLKALRHRRPRIHLSLLAIMVLLWSQMALALHADCFALLASPMVAATASGHDHCAESINASDRILCDAHCNQGSSSPDTSRTAFSVLALPPDLIKKLSSVMRLTTGTPPSPLGRADAAWHRPTSHPASVLLI